VQHRILRPLDNRPASRIWPVSRCLRGVISVAGVRAVCISGYRGGCWPPSWRCRCGAGHVLILTLWWVSVVVASPAEERPAL
jgi:hypothetical protein